MTAAIKIQGVEEVQKKLDEALAGIIDRTGSGIAAAGQFIKAEAQQITPVDFGVLRNSAFSKPGVGDNPTVVVGYTAEYAPYVHEAPMTLKGRPRADFGKTAAGESFGGGSGKGFYWDGGENKFLEKAVIRNLDKIVKIIARFAGRG